MSEFSPRTTKPSIFHTKGSDNEKNNSSQNDLFIQPKTGAQGLLGGPAFFQPKVDLLDPTKENSKTNNEDTELSETASNDSTSKGKQVVGGKKKGIFRAPTFIQPTTIQAKSTDKNIQLTGKEKRDLTPEEKLIKEEFVEFVKIVEERQFSDLTDKEQAIFSKKVAKFYKKMENGLSNFGEFLKVGSWGSDNYFRLRNKFFPDYLTTIKDEIDTIKLTINTSIVQLTDVLSKSITITNLAITKATQDRDQAQTLMADAAAKLADAKLKKADAEKTLSEYGTDEKNTPILAQFDSIIARYQAIISLFTSAFSGIGTDISVFEGVSPDIKKNEALLVNFKTKLDNATSLRDFQNLNKVEIPLLVVELNRLLSKVVNLTRTTDAVDEQGFTEEKTTMDATIGTLEGDTKKIKTDEIERRRLAEIERKKLAEIERKRVEAERKKEEEEEKKKAAEAKKEGAGKVSTDDKAMLELSPKQFFIAYEQRAQKYFDQYYNRSSWKTFKKDHSDLFLTGKELADAAKYVYENAKKKNLKLIAPVELAVAQAKLEGGVKPKNKDSRTVINPMNVGVHDGGNDNKKASSLFEIRDEKGWEAARKEGLRYYYRAMYKLWMPDYDSVEKMLEYDHFDKNGNTKYTGRYATSVYYEAKVKAEVGIMRLTEDGKLLTKTIGGGKGTAEDKKSVYNYLKAFDKYSGKLKNTKYSALVTLKDGIPTSSSLKGAILAIQENEIYPDPSTFGKQKKKIYDGMGTEDKKGSTVARAKGTDGLASKFGPTIGFLYYHYLLTGGAVFNAETNVSLTDDRETSANDKIISEASASDELASLKTQYDEDDLDMIALGKEVVKYCKNSPDEVATFIDSLWYYEDDNIVFRLVKESTESEVKSWDLELLKKMEGIMTTQYFRIEGKAEVAVHKQLKEARELKEAVKEPKMEPSETENKNTGKNYIVTNGEAWVRNDKGQELNTSGKVYKKGEKHKIIAKGTKVVVIEEKNGRVKVKSKDGKTVYGWTNKSNLTKIASVTEIKAWSKKKVTATKTGEKNKEYAKLVLEAEELGITKFSDKKVKQTFEKIKNLEKIGNGKKLGKSESYYSDPKKTEIIILSTIHSIIKTEVNLWLAGDQKDKISNVKIGSFMIWNSYTKGGVDVSDELRTTNHGAKGRAIDINIDGTNFESDAALEMVNRIISNLPKVDGTYEVGLPFQGDFFPRSEKKTKTNKSGKLKTHKTAAQSGSKIVLDYIESDKLKKTFKDLQKKGYKYQLFPDYNNHLHLAVE